MDGKELWRSLPFFTSPELLPLLPIDLVIASAEMPATRCIIEQDRTLKVRFYGKLADAFGSERDIAIEMPCTVAQLRQWLAKDQPEAAETLLSGRVKACIGNTIVGEGDSIPKGEVLELLAPVSGG